MTLIELKKRIDELIELSESSGELEVMKYIRGTGDELIGIPVTMVKVIATCSYTNGKNKFILIK